MNVAKFKLIISSSDGTTKAVDVEGNQAQPLIGKRIGETIDGRLTDLPVRLW